MEFAVAYGFFVCIIIGAGVIFSRPATAEASRTIKAYFFDLIVMLTAVYGVFYVLYLIAEAFDYA